MTKRISRGGETTGYEDSRTYVKVRARRFSPPDGPVIRPPGARQERAANIRARSRKEPVVSQHRFRRSKCMAINGKTLYHLGFRCGKMGTQSSTPLISAFLTTPRRRADTRLPRPWERDRLPLSFAE